MISNFVTVSFHLILHTSHVYIIWTYLTKKSEMSGTFPLCNFEIKLSQVFPDIWPSFKFHTGVSCPLQGKGRLKWRGMWKSNYIYIENYETLYTGMYSVFHNLWRARQGVPYSNPYCWRIRFHMGVFWAKYICTYAITGSWKIGRQAFFAGKLGPGKICPRHKHRQHHR